MASKILIVDDDNDTLGFLNLILTRQGYQTVVARDGMEALRLAHSANPDLVILDVMMPGMDGYEVARSLRRHPDTALTPILMYTAKTQMADKLMGYDVGVDIYLTKPIHPVELQANIKALLAQRKSLTETHAQKGYVLGVLAAKGGLGVSTVALNLAIIYHQKQNAKVIAAELRPGQGTWAQELEITPPRGLADLLQMNPPEITRATVDSHIVSTQYGARLLLASNDPKEVELAIATSQLEAVIQQMAGLAQLVVLDIGSYFLPAFNLVIDLCDEVILVTEPQPGAVKRTRLLVDELKLRGFGSSKVLTLVTVNHSRADMTLPVSQIETILKSSVALGFPPATELAYHAAVKSLPLGLVQPDGLITQQFGALADQVARHIAKS
jgi:CheY-like chemotaxis protein/MinD-like ATPase involved in chromosome partitioning or flagellar assembly